MKRLRDTPIGDGEEVADVGNGQQWRVTWHPPSIPPDGTNHGSAAVCKVEGGIVLISTDGQSWGLPGGRPEGTETLEETMRREVMEEACAEVEHASLLGFSRSTCVAGVQLGTVLVRSFWRAQAHLSPWDPQFEIPQRRVFPVAEVGAVLARSHTDGSAAVVLRAFFEATWRSASSSVG